MFTITRDQSAGALDVSLLLGGTAAEGVDYTVSGPALTGSVVSFLDGVAAETITVTPLDDGDDEGDETVTVTVDAGLGYTVGSPAVDTATISDNDVPTFLGAPVESYGGAQDDGSAVVEILDDGDSLSITGNGWKKVEILPDPYEVTPLTVLDFDFSSTAEGEVHGIGLDTDDFLSVDTAFQLFGTQFFGFQTHHDYVTGTKHYTIPVGEFFTGTFDRLFFVNDHDVASADAESVFSNVVLTEVAP